jgi:hypothetical protein
MSSKQDHHADTTTNTLNVISSGASSGAAGASEYLIGSSGGAQLQDILRTAAQPEEAILLFQKEYGLPQHTSASLQLLDFLGCRRSEIHLKLLESLVGTLLQRIQSKDITDAQLQTLLERTFPYLEFRELRAIPIAIMAAQSSTPSIYLKELVADPLHRHMLECMPLHVKRRVWQIAPHEWRLQVEKVVAMYLDHKRALFLMDESSCPYDLYQERHHAGSASSLPPPLSPEERRRQDPALSLLISMIGDSHELYVQVLDILRLIIASGMMCIYLFCLYILVSTTCIYLVCRVCMKQC